MDIRRAKPEEASTLTEIAFAAKRHWCYPEKWIQVWQEVLTINPAFVARNQTYVAHLDGEIVGFYALVDNMKIVSLEHLWVRPSAMGRGLGRALFEHAVERAKEAGAKAIEIESDPNAQGFYERLGAHLANTKATEVDGQSRIIPVLVYEIRTSS